MATNEIDRASGGRSRRQEVDFDRLFNAQSVAVLGASISEHIGANQTYLQAKAWCERRGAEFFPVNPKWKELEGIKCYSSLAALPHPMDLVVVIISDVERALRDSVEANAAFVLVFAAGFGEVGPGGLAREKALSEILAASSTRLIGPNTTASLFEECAGTRSSGIALITHSGAQGRPFHNAIELGYPLSRWVSTGNEVDLEAADFITYFAQTGQTAAIALYAEGFKDGQKFVNAARIAREKKVPIVVTSVGHSEIGRSAAQSHTAHMATRTEVTEGVFRQFKLIKAPALDSLMEISDLFARGGRPKGDGVAVYSSSGGSCALFSDLASRGGLNLPELRPETIEKLSEWLPDFARKTNPVDNVGNPGSDWRGPLILDTIMADPGVDVLVMPLPGYSVLSDAQVRHLVDLAERTDKLVCAIWASPLGDVPVFTDVLSNSNVIVFRTFAGCVYALSAYFDYWRDDMGEPAYRRASHANASDPIHEVRVIAGRTLTEIDAKQLVARFGVPVSRDVYATGTDIDFASLTAALRFPVVVKGSSQRFPHRSDVGLVRLDVTAELLQGVVDETMQKLRELGADDAGILISEQAPQGPEAILGIVQDDVFGPVVMFGVGGIYAELSEDVQMRVPPFGREVARDMIRMTRFSQILDGYRGAPKLDVASLTDAIMAVQELAIDPAAGLLELDLNPIRIYPEGVLVLDAFARVAT